MHLRSVGVVKPSSAPSLSISTMPTLASLAHMQSSPTTLGLPKMDLGSPRVEPDLSSKRWEDSSSLKGQKCQVSVAQGGVHHWKSPMSGTMTQTAKGMRKIENAIKIVKGAGTTNAKQTVAFQGTRAHTVRMPQVMTIAWLLSMANLMNLVIPQSVTV